MFRAILTPVSRIQQVHAWFEPSRVRPGAGLMSWLRRRVLWPLRQQLSQGATPEGLALSLAIGATLGLFPILGSTTVLCLAAGVALRLNHPALQIANYLVAALQLPLVYPFVRLGEGLVGARPASFAIPALMAEFRADPTGFLGHWGLTGLHGCSAGRSSPRSWPGAPTPCWRASCAVRRSGSRAARRLHRLRRERRQRLSVASMKEVPLKSSDYFLLLAAFLSFLLSVYLWFTGEKDAGVFVGIWVPSILSFGAYMRVTTAPR